MTKLKKSPLISTLLSGVGSRTVGLRRAKDKAFFDLLG